LWFHLLSPSIIISFHTIAHAKAAAAPIANIGACVTIAAEFPVAELDPADWVDAAKH
jgi:hypothetical protein